MGVLEQPGRGRVVAVGLVALVAALAAVAALYRAGGGPAEPAWAGRRVPGEPDRVVVEVLNTTDVAGLARAATRRLRDGGLDVVALGTDTGPALDSTRILVRRGALEAGERVASVLGVGRATASPDPGRLVDVTVRLGRDFARAAAAARDP